MSQGADHATDGPLLAGVAPPHPVDLKLVGTGKTISFEPTSLVIGAYTARDPEVLRSHIEELEASGVAPPSEVPSFIDLPPGLVCTRSHIEADPSRTSGEVEAVLFVTEDGIMVGVGSDHTDRIVETVSLREAKTVCDKPVGIEVFPIEVVQRQEASFELRSQLDGDLYQKSPLSGLLGLDDLLSIFQSRGGDLRVGLVLFGGTIPTLEGRIRFGHRFAGQLLDTSTGEAIRVGYSLTFATAAT